MKRRPVKLSFGERMREWRKARRELQAKIKEKLKDQLDIKQNHPPEPNPPPTKAAFITSPTQSTEAKPSDTAPISNPQNILEQAVNKLRAAARDLE